MKKFLIAGLIAGFAVAPAFASDIEAHCEAVSSEAGGDASGCACLGEAASSDAGMAAELLAVETDADIEGLSDAAKAAIAACWPDAE